MSPSTKEVAKLEREVVKHAMRRLKKWKKDHPGGLIPWGKIGCIDNRPGYDMVVACLALEKARRK